MNINSSTKKLVFSHIILVVAFTCTGLLFSCNGGGQKESTNRDSSATVGAPAEANKTAAVVNNVVIPPRPKGDSTPIMPKMVTVKGGSFKMGADTGDNEWIKPAHIVHLSDFSIGKYEVTLGEFRRFMNTGTYVTDAEKDGFSYIYDGKTLIYKKEGITWEYDMLGKKQTDERHPVIHVSRNDADAYCRWQSRLSGKTFRVPTEAEWEYAAKGGPRHDKYRYSGSDILDSVGWYFQNAGSTTHPVGTRHPNGIGIHDMSGSLWEWCSDRFGKYPAEEQTDPKGPPTGENGIVRGGAWRWFAVCAQCTYRRDMLPNFNASGIGFRVAASGANK